jgi:hypothetical protein
MLLEQGIKLLDLKKSFKAEFGGLLIYEGSPNKVLSSKNKTLTLELTKKTTIREFEKFLQQFNVSIKIYNSSGIKVDSNVEMSEIQNFTKEEIELDFVKKNLKLISSLKDSTLFLDMDWLNRIYHQIIYATETIEDKKLVIKSLQDTLVTNSKFTQDDYDHFIKQLN